MVNETETGAVSAPIGPATPKGRITFVETVYHAQADGTVTTAELRYAKMLETDGQPYVRKTLIPTEWTLLDTGWLSDGKSGVVHVQSVSAPIEIGFEIGSEGKSTIIACLMIPINEAQKLMPVDPKLVYLRSMSQEPAKAILSIFPR